MFVEVVNMVIGSNIMLFVSEEWVVFVVYVEVQVMINGGVDFYYVIVRVVSSNFFVFWVNIFFYGKILV